MGEGRKNTGIYNYLLMVYKATNTWKIHKKLKKPLGIMSIMSVADWLVDLGNVEPLWSPFCCLFQGNDESPIKTLGCMLNAV